MTGRLSRDFLLAGSRWRREAALSPGTRLEVLYKEQDFRRYQSGQLIVFSGMYIITILQYVYMWLILQYCGHSGPTGTFGNHVLRTKPRAQAESEAAARARA